MYKKESSQLFIPWFFIFSCYIRWPKCGRRRRREEEIRLLNTAPQRSCDEEKDITNDTFDRLVETGAVSEQCLEVLQEARTHECIPINEVNNGSPTTECPATEKLDGSGYCVHSDCKDDYPCPLHSTRRIDDMCYESFENCECDFGYYRNDLDEVCVPSPDGSSCPPGKELDASGDCVDVGCQYNFICPGNSKRKHGEGCYSSFANCECEEGYINRPFDGTDYCVVADCPEEANFACPSHSSRILGQQCYDTFGDCECDDGYFKSGDVCVLPGSDCPKMDASGDCVASWCDASFHCPDHSSRIQGRQCYDSFDDCECASGFTKNGECCEDNSSICPSGRHVDGSGDCVKEWCLANFICPDHSSRKHSRECYNNFEDCKCDSGYAKDGDVCVPNCPGGQKLDGHEYCVMDWCNHNYQCPPRGVRKPSRECYNNLDDCDCEAGYKKQTHNGDDFCIANWCNDNFSCPLNSYRKPGQQCYDTFGNDCLCLGGFHKSGDQCVPDTS